jgi:multicomponent Na+:H+ antiporter subunit D
MDVANINFAAGGRMLCSLRLAGAAIVFGSVVALRQERLKLLLAGGLLQAVPHATAKAAMFMAAGSIYATLGQDRIMALGGVGRILPISVLAFALSGLALMGLPPGGAYLAKELLLQAAAEKGQWWWAVVLQAGGIFTGAYVVLVLAHALAAANEPISPDSAAPRIREVAALALALCSLLLGLVPWEAYLSIPHGVASDKLGLGALSKTLLPILGGAVVAILLGRWECPPGRLSRWKALMVVVGPVRRAGLALSAIVEGCDNVLRQWPTACISLLTLAALFGASMLLSF